MAWKNLRRSPAITTFLASPTPTVRASARQDEFLREFAPNWHRFRAKLAHSTRPRPALMRSTKRLSTAMQWPPPCTRTHSARCSAEVTDETLAHIDVRDPDTCDVGGERCETRSRTEASSE